MLVIYWREILIHTHTHNTYIRVYHKYKQMLRVIEFILLQRWRIFECYRWWWWWWRERQNNVANFIFFFSIEKKYIFIICMYTHMYICMCVRIYIYVCTHIYVCMDLYIYIYIYIYVYMYAFVYINMYVYVYMCTVDARIFQAHSQRIFQNFPKENSRKTHSYHIHMHLYI